MKNDYQLEGKCKAQPRAVHKYIHAGREAEKGELPHIIGGNMNVYSIMENNMEVPQNT